MPNSKTDNSEFPIDILNTVTEVASGQHYPGGGPLMWPEPTVNMDLDLSEEEIDEEGLTKEALGLTDIPTSIDGGEVLNFPGTPQNPGLSREQGDDEETDYFGAAADVSDVPPINDLDLAGIEENDQSHDDFINFLYKKEMKVIFQSLNKFSARWGDNNFMRPELLKLEEYLQKTAQVSDAVKGTATGAATGLLMGLIPGINLIPAPLRAIVGGGGGLAASVMADYLENNPQEKNAIKQQNDQVESIRAQLQQYGVTDQELNQLGGHSLTPGTIVDAMKERNARMPSSWPAAIQKLSYQYVVAFDKWAELVNQVHNKVNPQSTTAPEPEPKSTPPGQIAQQTTTPKSQVPGRKPEAFSGRGAITRPGDPYTYDKDPNSEAYIIRSAPAGKENAIGKKIMPGAPGYDLVRAADPGAKQKPIALGPDAYKDNGAFTRGQQAAKSGNFQQAIKEFQDSYQAHPTPEGLFNLGKAQHDSGDLSSAVDTFQKYKQQYPDDWTKNQGLVPQDIQDLMNQTYKPIASGDEQGELKPTQPKIEKLLSNFLLGVPIRTQTQNGMTTVLDSKRVRNLTQTYLQDITHFKDPKDGIQLASTGIVTDFGPAIEEGLKQVMARGKISPDQMEGVFNGLVWQALRKLWAKTKKAPFSGKRQEPTDQSAARRLKQVDRQDQRWLDRAERRSGARREARKLLVNQILKNSAK